MILMFSLPKDVMMSDVYNIQNIKLRFPGHVFLYLVDVQNEAPHVEVELVQISSIGILKVSWMLHLVHFQDEVTNYQSQKPIWPDGQPRSKQFRGR